MGVDSYAALVALDSREVIRLLDENRQHVPVDPADAFLAVIVLSAVIELRETAKSLDKAKRAFEFATIVLAAAAVIVGIIALS
jgi:cytoskeletal protein RodZ